MEKDDKLCAMLNAIIDDVEDHKITHPYAIGVIKSILEIAGLRDQETEKD